MAAALLTHGADVDAKDNAGCGGRSLFRAMVGVAAPAVADRDGIASCTCTDPHRHMEMRTHTLVHVEVCI